MNNQDYNEFKSKMTAMGELYSKDISDSLLDIYWNALKNISIQDFNKGISLHTVDQDSGRFFPKPANIYGNVTVSQGQYDDNAADSANLAWEQVMLAASGRRVDITDQKALAAIRSQGGINRIGLTNYDDLVWVKKEFIEAYVMYGRTPLDELPAHLSEVMNSERIERKSTFKLLGLG